MCQSVMAVADPILLDLANTALDLASVVRRHLATHHPRHSVWAHLVVTRLADLRDLDLVSTVCQTAWVLSQ